jgi:hypothetical protein
MTQPVDGRHESYRLRRAGEFVAFRDELLQFRVEAKGHVVTKIAREATLKDLTVLNLSSKFHSRLLVCSRKSPGIQREASCAGKT